MASPKLRKVENCNRYIFIHFTSTYVVTQQYLAIIKLFLTVIFFEIILYLHVRLIIRYNNTYLFPINNSLRQNPSLES